MPKNIELEINVKNSNQCSGFALDIKNRNAVVRKVLSGKTQMCRMRLMSTRKKYPEAKALKVFSMYDFLTFSGKIVDYHEEAMP